MKKTIPVVLIAVLLIVSMFPLNVEGELVGLQLESIQSGTGTDYVAFADITALGASFVSEYDCYVASAHMYLKRVGTVTATIRGAIYSMDGTYNSGSATPDESLAVSTNTITVSTMSTSFADIEFTFDGTLAITADTGYFLVVELVSGSFPDSTHALGYRGYASGRGEFARIAGGSWINVANRYQNFDLTVNLDPSLEVVDYNSGSGSILSPVNAVHPTAGASVRSAVFVTFTVPNYNFVVENAQLDYAGKTGSPVATLKAGLYSITGEYGTYAVPDELLVTSTSSFISSTTLMVERAVFVFTDEYTLTAGSHYALVVWCDSASAIDTSNYINFGCTPDNTTHDGNSGYFTQNIWAVFQTSNCDNNFWIYGEAFAPPTPTPSPSPSPSPSPTAAPTATPTPAPIALTGIWAWIPWIIIAIAAMMLLVIITRAKLKVTGGVK